MAPELDLIADRQDVLDRGHVQWRVGLFKEMLRALMVETIEGLLHRTGFSLRRIHELQGCDWSVV